MSETDLTHITNTTQILSAHAGVAAYGKAIAYIVAALVAAVVGVQGPITASVVVQLGVVTLGAVLVYLVPNLSAGVGAYLKAAIAVVIAGATALVPLLAGGVSGQEVAVILVACLGALGVGVVPHPDSYDLAA